MQRPNDMNDLEARALDGLRATQELARETETNAGRYRDPTTGLEVNRNFGEVIALMHSELSEAEYRAEPITFEALKKYGLDPAKYRLTPIEH
jgi:hypothetical protein